MQTYIGPIPTYIRPMPTYIRPMQTYLGPMPTYIGPMPTYIRPMQTYIAMVCCLPHCICNVFHIETSQSVEQDLCQGFHPQLWLCRFVTQGFMVQSSMWNWCQTCRALVVFQPTIIFTEESRRIMRIIIKSKKYNVFYADGHHHKMKIGDRARWCTCYSAHTSLK